jgi:hypothetical protein
MRAALYARVSTNGHGQDPEMQLRELREYCQRRGWERVGAQQVRNASRTTLYVSRHPLHRGQARFDRVGGGQSARLRDREKQRETTGLLEAEKKFRRIKGYQEILLLKERLNPSRLPQYLPENCQKDYDRASARLPLSGVPHSKHRFRSKAS